MPIYNNPQIGQAFGNLAQMFAPPSSADVANAARARLTNQQADQLAWLFENSGDPTASSRSALTGVQGYGQTPGGFTYQVDQNNATARRGQDIDADVARRGQDVTAATSRDNNANTVRGGVIGQIYGTPIAPGYMIPGLPAEAAAAIGLPALPGATGAPKPLSEVEVKGAAFGRLSPEQQQAALLSSVPVESVIMNGQPTLVPRDQAWGQQPAPAPTGAPETQNYMDPAGRRGTAVFDAGRRTWVDTATGQPLPQGSITFNSSLQGGAAETGLAPTTANQTAATAQEAVLNAMDADLNAAEGLLRQNPGVAGLPGQIRGTLQNIASSAGELSAAFGGLQPDAKMSLDQAQAAIQRIVPSRVPAIQQYALVQASLAYRLAQMNNPTGEVSRQAFERALESISGGFFANNQSALEGVGAMRDQVARLRANSVNTLRNPGQQPPSAPAPAGVPGVRRYNSTTGRIE